MRFTIKQLRYFDAALRTGSISGAATEMNISQSSITAAIDTVEQTVGAELFRRIPAKGILPTQTGRDVGARVAAFLEQARVFESDLMSISGDPTGVLRLACYEPTAPYVLPPLLKRISAHYPDIRIDIREGDMHAIGDMLRSGAVDAALTYRRETPKDQKFVPLFRARPWALLPESSPLAGRASVTLQDLADQPMIFLDVPGTKSYFVGMFEAQGLTPQVVHTTTSGSVLRGLVAAQFGYSILNICGPTDRDGHAGYRATPIAGEIDAPLYGVAFAAPLEDTAIVRAVVATSKALAREGGFDHLLMQPH